MKYIDAEKLIEILEEEKKAEYENCGGVNSKTGVLQEVQELIASLQQEQPECIEKTVRISPGLLSNFGTSTYVLYVDLTQDEMAKVAPLGLDSGKIKIKIVCE